MVRKSNHKSRVTPKGTIPEIGCRSVEQDALQNLQLSDSSPIIVPIVMFGALLVGVVLLLINYIVPISAIGMPHSAYIFAGLGLILVGIVTATQYK